MPNACKTRLPHISPPLLGGFHWFVQHYLRRHFHSVAIHRQHWDQAEISAHDSLLVVANHASWWDPLTAIFLAKQVFAAWPMYAPIDAQALEKYKMFARLGFFPVEQHSHRGAAAFLRTGREILARPGRSLWLTPEGRFADVRDQTAEFMPGLAHLASKLAAAGAAQGHRVWCLPAAVEYTFWEERQPELLSWIGRPICLDHQLGYGKSQWQSVLSERLRETQRDLASAAIARDAAPFQLLLGGHSGSFFLYDWWRQAVGLASGKRIAVNHGNKFHRR